MNRFKGTAMGLTAGTLVGLAAGFTATELLATHNSRVSVERCTDAIRSLGGEALKVTVLPKPCDTFAGDFDSQTATVTINQDGKIKTTKSKSYTLPDPYSFEKTQIANIESDERMGNDEATIFAPTVGALLMGGIGYAIGRAKELSSEDAKLSFATES